MNRIARLHSALAALDPIELEIIDESHLHAGHAGAATGRGHFRVRLVSNRFTDLKPLARHRAVYEALGALLETDIHALTLETLSPAEAARPPSRAHITA